MVVRAVFAVPFAIAWMIVTASLSIGSFAVGFVLGFAIVMALHVERIPLDPRRLPDQLAAFGLYAVTLGRDIWLSSVDVTRRVLNPDLPLRPGLIRVSTQDGQESEVTAAFSAHGITITPGELVVDFEGNHIMLVHCLDVEASSRNATQAQARRLHLFERILGR